MGERGFQVRRRELGRWVAAWLVAPLPSACLDGPTPPPSVGPFVDVHAHIFNATDLPFDAFVDGFLTHDHGAPDLLSNIARTAVASIVDGSIATGAWEFSVLADPPQERDPGVRVSAAKISDSLVGALRLHVDALRNEAQRRSVGADSLIALLQDAVRLDPELQEWILRRQRTDAEFETATGGERPEAAHQMEVGDPVDIAPQAFDLQARVTHLARLLVDFLGSRQGLLTHYLRAHSDLELCTPILVDFDGWNGSRANAQARTPLVDQIRVTARLADQMRNPERGWGPTPGPAVLPFSAFNPLREATADPRLAASMPGASTYDPFGTGDSGSVPAPSAAGLLPGRPEDAAIDIHSSALALLRYSIETRGFIGVKLYPTSGFRPLGNQEALGHDDDCSCESCIFAWRIDQALEAFFSYCVAMEVPVITHANRSNVLSEGADEFSNPSHWRAVLQRYPTLRLNLGHFGHDTRDAKALAWVREYAELMACYPHVYGDVGASVAPYDRDAQDSLETAWREIQTPDVLAWRLLYATDWFLNSLWEPGSREHPARMAAFVRRVLPDTRADRFVRRNALRFLGLSVAGNLNRARVLARYTDAPSWTTVDDAVEPAAAICGWAP